MEISNNDLKIIISTLLNPSDAWRINSIFHDIIRSGELAKELHKNLLEKHNGSFEIIIKEV